MEKVEKVLIILVMITSIFMPITAFIMPLISIYVLNSGITAACIMCWCILPILTFISAITIYGVKEFL